MSDIIKFLIKFALEDLPKALKNHLARTIFLTFSVTIVLQWLILGPWGSGRLRNIYIHSIITNDEDRHSAGFFRETDAAILEKWEAAVENNAYSDDYQENPSSIQLARYQSQRALPPFHPLGSSVTVSSPDCYADRPGYGQAILNIDREDLRQQGWQLGQSVRFSNKDGRGEPVIAILTEPKRPPMDPDIHFHLNHAQYKMLNLHEKYATVQAQLTKAQIKQSSIDSKKDVPGVKCPKIQS